MIRYRAEFFSRQLQFIDHSEVEGVPVITEDYVTLPSVSFSFGSSSGARQGNFVILKRDGRKVYEGMIVDISYERTAVKVTLKPLLYFLNIKIVPIPSDLEKTHEGFVADKLNQLFVGNDTLQNLPGFEIEKDEITTPGIVFERDKKVINLYSFLVEAFAKVGLVLKMNIDIKKRKFVCRMFHLKKDEPVRFALNVSDIIDFRSKIKQSGSKPNKILYVNEENPTESVTYYRHEDGLIDENSLGNRDDLLIYEEKTAKKYSKDEVTVSFRQAAKEDAEKSMAVSSGNEEIEIVRKHQSFLFPEIQLGQQYLLLDPFNGKEYNSTLTGYLDDGKTVTLIFGLARSRLSQILAIRNRD